MIQGLKVTVPGLELIALCEQRAGELIKKADDYADAMAKVSADERERASGLSNDPYRGMIERQRMHRQEAQELMFTARHLVTSETYVLDRQDLQRLGIVEEAY